MRRKAWNLKLNYSDLVDIPGVHPIVARLLAGRGITATDRISAFLEGNKNLAADPFLLPDMAQAVNRVYRALMAGEKIAIHGDSDADGITATAVLVQGLTELGGKVTAFIPHLLNDGHGLRSGTLKQLAEEGVSLVITADCGISAIAESIEARKLGMDMVITDHHIITGSLPDALAVVETKRADSSYTGGDLAGVGVAYKLLEAVFAHSGRDHFLDNLLDFVAVGTVTDMAPLVGENRYLVKKGLEVLNSTTRPGFQELIRSSGLKAGNIDSGQVSWVLGPRLNAMARVDQALTSYRLLMTEDRLEAQKLAEEIEIRNKERQQLTSDLLIRVREIFKSKGSDGYILIAGSPEFPQGVMGLAAGRLSEEFYRPVVLIREGEEICRGSARSIPGFNLVEALESCHDLLLDFGGHSMAAGFAARQENMPEVERRLEAAAETKLADVELKPHLAIDLEVTLPMLTGDTFNAIKKMEPFGVGNQVPVFLSRKVKVSDIRKIGSQGGHLDLKLSQEQTTWPAIGFGQGNAKLKPGMFIDVVYSFDMHVWNGKSSLRLKILDLVPL